MRPGRGPASVNDVYKSKITRTRTGLIPRVQSLTVSGSKIPKKKADYKPGHI